MSSYKYVCSYDTTKFLMQKWYIWPIKNIYMMLFISQQHVLLAIKKFVMTCVSHDSFFNVRFHCLEKDFCSYVVVGACKFCVLKLVFKMVW